MHVGPGFGAEVADPGLDINAAIGLDDEQAVEANRATRIAADGDADATNLGAVALAGAYFSLVPLELLGAAIERFLDKGAGCVLLLAGHERSEWGFAFRGVNAADGNLIYAEFARGLGEDRLHDGDAL